MISKWKIRQAFKRLACPHREYRSVLREFGTQSVIITTCENCGKVWVKM